MMAGMKGITVMLGVLSRVVVDRSTALVKALTFGQATINASTAAPR